MPQPVKLSDDLIDAARDAAPLASRSLASQIEHWATLGRAVESGLTADQSASLKRSVRESAPKLYQNSRADLAQVLADAMERVSSPDFAASTSKSLRQKKGHLYGTNKAFPGYLVRQEADGSLTPGRMVDRQFVAVCEVTDLHRSGS
jgi:hypothetical protein